VARLLDFVCMEAFKLGFIVGGEGAFAKAPSPPHAPPSPPKPSKKAWRTLRKAGTLNWGLSGYSHKLFVVSFDQTFSKVCGCGQRPQKTPFLFDNFFFAAHTCKEKVAMESERPRGYSHLASANSLPAFLFDTGGTKRKAIKREMPCMGLCPIPRRDVWGVTALPFSRCLQTRVLA